MMIRRNLTIAAMAAAAIVGLPAAASAGTAGGYEANAPQLASDGATTDGLGGQVHHYDVRDKAVNNKDYTNKGNEIGSCKVTTTGGTCTIANAQAANRTIGLALGAQRGPIAAQLNMSASLTQTVTVSCTSPALKAGQVWHAWPRGVRWQYKIHHWVQQSGSDGMSYDAGTSGWLNAFDPSSSKITCGL